MKANVGEDGLREFLQWGQTLTIIGSSLIKKAEQVAEALNHFNLAPQIVLAEHGWSSSTFGIGWATDQWHSRFADRETQLIAISTSGFQKGIWNYARHRRTAKRSGHLLIILGRDTPITAEYVDAIIAAKDCKATVYLYRTSQTYPED